MPLRHCGIGFQDPGAVPGWSTIGTLDAGHIGALRSYVIPPGGEIRDFCVVYLCWARHRIDWNSKSNE